MGYISYKKSVDVHFPKSDSTMQKNVWTHPVIIFPPLVFLILFAPLMPYAPTCGNWDYALRDMEMAAEYRERLKITLEAEDVRFLSFGDTILVRLLGGFDGRPLGDGPTTLEFFALRVQVSLAKWIAAHPGAVSSQGYVYLHPEKFKDVSALDDTRSLDFFHIAQDACRTLIRDAIDAGNWRPATAEELAREKPLPFKAEAFVKGHAGPVP